MIETASSPRPRLLVSVQNEEEARLAHSLGVRWIDLKAPVRGSLGCPDVATAHRVAQALACAEDEAQASADTRPGNSPARQCQTSVALGELQTLNTLTAIELLQLFPIAKVGLAGWASTDTPAATTAQSAPDSAMAEALEKLFAKQSYDGQLVLASYADHQRAAAPSPEQVIELARQFGARYVLIDTFVKDGLGLFHWQSPEQIATLGQQAASHGAELVVAGSLRSSDWPFLQQAAPAIIGVRGSVCTSDRASSLCPERIAQWLAWSAG